MPGTISRQTARRYVLGRQGVWPGRRWQGEEGTAAALRQCQAIQIDTINVIARNHELKLWSRVADYSPAMLDRLLYEERRFFDFGSILMVYPADELPYWQAIMRREGQRLAAHREKHAEVFAHVLDEIRSRDPLSSRDFEKRERIPGGFNTVKDTAMALYTLWIGGELMTHGRRNFDRLYDVFEKIAGRPFDSCSASEEEAERFFAIKAARDLGLASAAEWARRAKVFLHRTVGAAQARDILEGLTADGVVMCLGVEGRREPCFALAEDLPLLETLEAGGIPAEWTPLDTTTRTEVNILAPLDNVIWDRARTKALFDFDYVWEVYKPAHLRRWGYYTLPILWGDRLAARFACRLNRKTATLHVEGFWLEEAGLAEDSDFLSALAAGLRRFAAFHQAACFDLSAVEPDSLRASLKERLNVV